MRPPHHCSLYALFIEVFGTRDFDGSPHRLGNATATLYEEGGATYLISNWHVFSGLHAQELVALDKTTSLLPTSVRVHFPKENALEEIVHCDYPLQDSSGKHLWFEHPLKNKVDVAALPIEPPELIATRKLNDSMRQPRLVATDDFFYVTQEVWAIGFPKGIRVSGLPIWKRATIAAEPRFSSAAERHKILLDTATRDGMSGSPVLYVGGSPTPMIFDGSSQVVDFPPSKCLLGIYSGRIAGSDELSAQLGIAWRAEAISDIVSARMPYTPTTA